MRQDAAGRGPAWAEAWRCENAHRPYQVTHCPWLRGPADFHTHAQTRGWPRRQWGRGGQGLARSASCRRAARQPIAGGTAVASVGFF